MTEWTNFFQNLLGERKKKNDDDDGLDFPENMGVSDEGDNELDEDFLESMGVSDEEDNDLDKIIEVTGTHVRRLLRSGTGN